MEHDCRVPFSSTPTSVKPPKVTQSPTLPFSTVEMKQILKACDSYGGKQERMRAFVLTMRFTGLRTGDAIRLSKSQVTDGKVFVRTAKTGQRHRARSALVVILRLS